MMKSKDITVAAACSCAARLLNYSAGEGTDVALECRVLMEQALEIDTVSFFKELQTPLSDEQIQSFCVLFNRRLTGEPVSYITGHREFMSLDFEVSPSCLIPRPETELLVENTIEYIQKAGLKRPLILDIGTGSGAIAVSLAYYISDASIVAVDISEHAVSAAASNASRLGVADRIDFFVSNLFESVPDGMCFDIIVSNPPYIAKDDFISDEVRLFEPHQALFSTGGGLDITEAILAGAGKFMTAGGRLAVEIADSRAGETVALFLRSGFENISVLKDLCGRDRVICAERRA